MPVLSLVLVLSGLWSAPRRVRSADEAPPPPPEVTQAAAELENLGFKPLDPSDAEQKALDAAKDHIPGWIAFQSLRDNNWNIYSMRADGTELRRLTDDPTEDEHPAWSPNGSLIAFDTRRSGHWQVFTMKPDGSEQKLLIDNARSPAWSADGRFIAFERDWKLLLFTVADRSEREIVPGKLDKALIVQFNPDQPPRPFNPTTPLNTIKAFKPAFSTDGKQIAFTTDVRFPWEVAAMPLDGTTVTIVGWGREPVWLPGTDKLVFTKEAGRGGTDIWVRSVAGGRPSLASSLEAPWGYEYTPAVSPDGRWLVWAAAGRHDPLAANFELFIRKLDDPAAQPPAPEPPPPLRLTFHSAPDRCPSIFIQTEAK